MWHHVKRWWLRLVRRWRDSTSYGAAGKRFRRLRRLGSPAHVGRREFAVTGLGRFGSSVAKTLVSRGFIDYLEVGEGMSIVEIRAPDKLCGSSLAECRLRRRYLRAGITLTPPRRVANHARASWSKAMSYT